MNDLTNQKRRIIGVKMVKEMLRRSKLSQEKLSNIIGISVTYMSRLLNSTDPDRGMYVSIYYSICHAAREYGIKPEDFNESNETPITSSNLHKFIETHRGDSTEKLQEIMVTHEAQFKSILTYMEAIVKLLQPQREEDSKVVISRAEYERLKNLSGDRPKKKSSQQT